jgi:hydrogenase-4 membrane subunit HyfE
MHAKDKPNPVVWILGAGVLLMIAAAVARDELGVRASLGFWACVGLALPAAVLALQVRDRSNDFAGAFVGCSLTLGWAVMIALGVVHHELHAGRALGYWLSVGLALPVAVVAAAAQEPAVKRKAVMADPIGTFIGGGVVLMIAFGVAARELGVGRPIGFWSAVVLAVPFMVVVRAVFPPASRRAATAA